ncbi:MAG: RNA-guided endonuclease InsQ/TnpB family protein, partial [Prochloraceae cyanobacterium]
MIVYEFKAKGKDWQYKAIDEAILTSQFVRNKCLRLWMDAKREEKIDKYKLNKYCSVLAKEYTLANKLNSMARQSAAERAWSAISRFYDNCKKRTARLEVSSRLGRSKQKIKGKKAVEARVGERASGTSTKTGYPKFKKNSRSVEYKSTGWKLDENRKSITFTDKNKIGKLKLKGTYDLNYYQLKQIKRVRVVRRADGYYVQFCIDAKVRHQLEPTNKTIGLDVGLKVRLVKVARDNISNYLARCNLPSIGKGAILKPRQLYQPCRCKSYP